MLFDFILFHFVFKSKPIFFQDKIIKITLIAMLVTMLVMLLVMFLVMLLVMLLVRCSYVVCVPQ